MNKEDAFLKLVAKSARDKDSEFFIISGEGREFETTEIEGEDLFGWLIPLSKAEDFKKEYSNESVTDKWLEFQCFAIWSESENGISIEFKNM